jgi:anti-sigma factor RsiW
MREQKMGCTDVQKRLKAFLDSELSPKKAKGVRGHLSSCPACSQELEELSRTWDLLGELPQPEVQPNLFPRIMDRLEAEAGRGLFRSFFERLIFLPTPALATLALIVGLLLGGRMGSSLYLAYSEALAPRPEGELSAQAEDPLYLEIFDDFAPESLGEAYFDFLAEKEGSEQS